jgi:hypothetical protein
MNDQAAKYVKMLKANIDRVVVVLVYVLLGALVWFWYNEESMMTEPSEARKANLQDPVADNPSARLLTQAKETPDITKYPTIEQVRRFNMFDYKTVKEKQEIEKAANNKFRQAQDLASRGQTQEAVRLLRETLQSFPTHKEAKELFDKLTAQPETGSGAGAPQPGSTPAPDAGVPTPAQIQ